MRIIAGRLKGRTLVTPGKGTHDIRPTSDMTREALFSILGKWPEGAFLDLFAGTGAVGVEAWSRGYAPVTVVEQPGRALEILRANTRGTEVQILARDARRLPQEAFQGLSVIFADPPYKEAAALFEALAPRLREWLAPDGVLVWESERGTSLPEVQGWSLEDTRGYGRAHLAFFVPTPMDAVDPQ